jgi:hypothetical protein
VSLASLLWVSVVLLRLGLWPNLILRVTVAEWGFVIAFSGAWYLRCPKHKSMEWGSFPV